MVVLKELKELDPPGLGQASPCPGAAFEAPPPAHVSQEHRAGQKDICNYKSGKRGERGREERKQRSGGKRRWSAPRKRLTLEKRRGKQARVEDAAHDVAPARVDVHTERHGPI